MITCWKALLCSLVVASYRIQSFCLCDVWCHRCVLMTIYEDHVIVGLWLMGVDYVDLGLKVSEKASTNLAQESLSQASLVVKWLRIHLPMQRTQVQSLVREDTTHHGATKPMSHNYWTCEPRAVIRNEKPRQQEAHTPQLETAPAGRNQRKPACSNEDPAHPKINNLKKKKKKEKILFSILIPMVRRFTLIGSVA